MANTTGSGRHHPLQMVHTFRKRFTFANTTAVPLYLGTLPPGGVVLRAGVVVVEAFNWGTNNLLDIGTTSDDDGFATNLSLATVGVIVADEMATSNDAYNASAIDLIATPDFSSTQATTGIGIVWVEYLADNDQ